MLPLCCPRFIPVPALVALLLAGLADRACAQRSLLQENYDPNGTLRIEVESVFDGTASRGHLPVRVTLRNMRKQERTWNLKFIFEGGWNQMAYTSNFRVSADAGTEPVHELMVPVPTALSGSGGSMYRSMTVEATSTGLPAARRSDSTYYSLSWPAMGISKKLADRNANRLDSAVQGRSGSGHNEAFGARFDPRMLPADWRGYSSLDALMITDPEWKAASPGARLAIIEWVRLGGTLELYTTGDPAEVLRSLDLPGTAEPSKELSLSLGEVRAWKWNGQDLEPNAMLNRYRNIDNRGADFADDYQNKNNWGLYRSFGGKSFNPWLVILLLIAFGIIVGPINLFVWAKPGKRHRLFFTTPVISLAASSLILLLILFNDGIGGSGLRIVLANLQSESGEKRLYVTQEQISRTGVLLGSGFRIEDPVFLSPVMIPPSEWNRIGFSNNTIASYSLSGQTFRGDWFQSRSEQGHFAQTVRPTRSRIELTLPSTGPEAPPKLFSSLEFTLDEFFYRDDQGNIWKAKTGGIEGGEEIALEPAEPKDLDTWWGRQLAGLSDSLGGQARGLWKRNGHFFAVSTDRNAGFVDTLGSIDWKRDKAIVFGTVTLAGNQPPTSNGNE